jgi:endoglucanase
MRLFNKNFRLYLLLPAFSFSLLLSHAQGFLRADGNIIVNEKDEKVILRGMGLGGWMLQEGYMFHVSNIGQQYRIKEKIAELVGEEKTNQFYNDWLLNHTRKIDVDSMAAWGFNSIRLPMHYALYTLPVDKEPVAGENTWLEKGFALTDSLLSWCKANKMYLILDMHAAPGGQGNDLNISDRDPSKPSLWESEANQKKMIALWQKLAVRYANEPWIGGYDIINEPNWGFEDVNDKRGTEEKKNVPLRKLMMDITAAIRAVDKKHIIIIEGNGFGNNYNGILPAWDNNMVLSFHKYGNFNDSNSIKRFLQLRQQYNVPLWMGESGENSDTWFTEAIQLVEKNNIGWSWWQEKKMGINNPLEILVTPSYQKLLDYWNGKGSKPSEAEAEHALQKLIQAVRLESNVYHKDVIDAMFRQVQSNETKPSVKYVIGKSATISAIGFDFGRQRAAYYDKDTASYQYTPGVNTVGNRGHAYRNDGVDIKKGDSGFYVFNIEDGEWMQYTVDVAKKGTYTISFTVSAGTDSSKLSLSSDNQLLIKELAVPNTGGEEKWKVIEAKNIHLKKGTNKLKLYADKGGFTISVIHFTKQ